ncbi:hypothetical protein ZIOFF_018419 [Zingiber officinale]|uniref:Uncharacterized protein n=1 Tax=Zingiber officinale TaxID=94328 RepID=A0A8J5H6C7_ZINOF|nr:hypothetical protein ZIOFF_018419 [Zingiber officinale]
MSLTGQGLTPARVRRWPVDLQPAKSHPNSDKKVKRVCPSLCHSRRLAPTPPDRWFPPRPPIVDMLCLLAGPATPFIPKLRLILILNSFLGSSDSLVFSELFHSLAPRPLAARTSSLIYGNKISGSEQSETSISVTMTCRPTPLLFPLHSSGSRVHCHHLFHQPQPQFLAYVFRLGIIFDLYVGVGDMNSSADVGCRLTTLGRGHQVLTGSRADHLLTTGYADVLAPWTIVPLIHCHHLFHQPQPLFLAYVFRLGIIFDLYVGVGDMNVVVRCSKKCVGHPTVNHLCSSNEVEVRVVQLRSYDFMISVIDLVVTGSKADHLLTTGTLTPFPFILPLIHCHHLFHRPQPQFLAYVFRG